MSAIVHQGYRIEPVYQKLTDNLRNEIVAFWLDNGALPEDRARQRVDQVAFVVRSSANDVAGISTVYAAPFGPDGDLYLYYRMFIAPAHRIPGLMQKVIRATRLFFDGNRALRAGARGMLIVTENPKLMHRSVRRLLERVFEYAGTDQRGIDVWRFDFTS
jgi:hypothetical protein